MNRTRASHLPLAALALLAAASCSERAEHTALGAAVAAERVREVRALLDHAGSDPDEIAASGWAPLHLAARIRDPRVLDALIEAGADLDRLDRRNGWTPLLHAIHRRNEDAARALIAAGAEVNRRGDSGVTPLAMAAGYGMADTVELLLERGAAPHLGALDANPLWAAAGGGAIRDFTDGPPLGQCFPEVIATLEAAAPDLRLPAGLSSRVLAWLASDPCAPVVARLLDEARAGA